MNYRDFLGVVCYSALFGALFVAYQYGGWQAIRRWALVVAVSISVLSLLVALSHIIVGFFEARWDS